MVDRKPWEEFSAFSSSATPEYKPWEAFGGKTKPEPKGFLGHARDLGLSAGKSAIAVPETLVGLADIATGGRVGKFLENKGGAIGFRPSQAKAFLSKFHTDGYLDQQSQFQEADGILDKTAVAIQNPSLIANTVVESAAPMLAGGVAARGLMAGTRLGQMGVKGAAAAGAIGEGSMMAGSQAAAIRQETDDGLLTPTQAGAAVATGALGTLFGYLGGRVAHRFGFGDIDTMIANGVKPQAIAGEIARQPPKSIPRQVIEGAISEGFLEELPQSISEQIIQNLALGKQWSEGVDDAAVMGTLAGMAMGGGASLYNGMTRPEPQDGGLPPPTAGTEPPTAPPQGFAPASERPVIDEAALGRAGVFPPAPAPIINKRALDPVATPSQQMGLDPAAGPMSAAAALAVDTGASGAMQQAAQAVDSETGEILETGARVPEQKQATDTLEQMRERLGFIEQQARVNGGWDRPLIEERDRLQAEIAKTEPTADQSGAATEMVEPAPAIDVSGRTDEQLRVLEKAGRDGWREAAVAEIQRRAAQQPATAPELETQPAAEDATQADASPVADIKAVIAKQIPDMTDAELQRAIDHYGPSHKRTVKLLKEVQKRSQGAKAPVPAVPVQAAPAAAETAPATAPEGWDGMAAEQRAAILTKPGGWSTAKGGLNVIGKQIAGRNWSAINPATRATIERLMQGEQTANVPKAQQVAPEAEEAGGQESEKAKWIKAAVDKSRLNGSGGVQLAVAPNGGVTFLGDPNTSKDGNALLANYEKALAAGATQQEIASALKAQKAAPAERDRTSVLTERWNALAQQYKEADDQGKASLRPEMDRIDAELKQATRQSLLEGKQQIQKAMAKRAKAEGARAAAMPVGSRLRPSEQAPEKGLYWEKTGPDEWTGRGDWFQNGKTRSSADLMSVGGLLPMEPAAEAALAQIPADVARPDEGKTGGESVIAKMQKRNRNAIDPGTGVSYYENDVSRAESELRQMIYEEQRSPDFAPSELPKAVEFAAKEANVTTEDLRNALLRGIDGDERFSHGRKKQIREAFRKVTFGEAPAEGAALEHRAVGVDDRELEQIAGEFSDAQAAMVQDEERVHHVFDAPRKDEVVRLQDKVTVYHKDHGWMRPAEAKARIEEWKQRAREQGDKNRSENSDRVVLSMFDLTGSWSKPWEEAGYQVFRFDIQDDPVVGDVNNFSVEFFSDWFGDFEGQDIYAILAGCPCTDFAVSGARHFAAKDKDGRTVASVKLVHQTLAAIEYFKPAVWAIENPVGRIEKLGGLPPWRLSFDPNHLGDPYTKKTLLWGRFNGDLPIAPVEPTEGSKMHSKYGGKSLATKNARSATPEGFAYGFFAANNAVDNPVMAIANKYDRLDRDLIARAVKAGMTGDQISEVVDDHYYMDLDDAAAEAALRDAIPPEPTKAATPDDAPEFTTLKDRYGNTVTVRTDDLSGSRERMPMFTKDGKRKATWIHRDNLDPTGEKRAEGAKEAADNPFFNVITTRDGSAFASEGAAERELRRLGLQDTHEVAPASEVSSGSSGFVVRRAKAREAAVPKSVNPSRPESSSQLIQDFIEGKRHTPPTVEEVEAEQKASSKEPGYIEPTPSPAEKMPAPAWWQEATPAERIFRMKASGIKNVTASTPWLKLDAADQRALDAQWGDRARASAARPQPGEDGYTLDLARKDLAALRAELKKQGEDGRPVDSRLNDRVRNFEKLVASMESAQKREQPARATDDDIDAMFDDVLADAIGEQRTGEAEPSAAAEEPASTAVTPEQPANQEAMAESLEDELRAQKKRVQRLRGGDATKLKAAEARLRAMRQSIFDAEDKWVPAARSGDQDALTKLEEAGFADTADAIRAFAPTAPRTAGKALKSAAKNAVSTLDDAINGLGKLFGGSGRLSSGITFDEETYAKAKPLFISAAANIRAASRDLRDVMKAVVDMVIERFGADTAKNMKPYVTQFVKDVRDGRVQLEQEQEGDERATVRVDGPQALVEMAAQEDGGIESRGAVGDRAADGREAGVRAGSGVDAAGVPAARSGRGRAARPDSAETGARGRPGALGARGNEAQQRGTDARVEVDGEAVAAPNIPAQNFQITADVALGKGGEVQKFNDNLAAIRALKQIESDHRRATPEEQAILARYVGWGGLANAFPDPTSGELFKDKWKARGEALRELLTETEYKAARRSTRNAHYTSETVVSAMWKAVERLGFKGGLVLESSMGTGNFVGLAPQRVPARFIGVEYDSLTARIAQTLYPQATVLHSGFQKVPVADNSFALNIGNPPFGSESLRFQFKPELQGVSIHNQFFRAGMDALRPGGIQAMVVSRFLMDAQDSSSRVALAKQAKLIAAIRLPDTAFKENARTEVVTDILFFQKMTPEEQAEMAHAFEARNAKGDAWGRKTEERQALAANVPAWVDTTTIPDPLGGEPMTVNAYFRDNPQNILGVLERSGSMQHGADMTVRLDDPAKLGERLEAAIARLPENIQNLDADVREATEARFKSMSDGLRIALANEEAGHLKLDIDGKLQRVIERETPEGGFEYAMQEITADSPWSDQLTMDADGRWYKLEVKTGEDGKPIKLLNKDGKATNRNAYERTTYATVADVPDSMRLGRVGFERLSSIVTLRDLLKRQLTLETADAAKAVMEGNRKALARAYEDFVAAHGPINRPANLRLAMTMPDGGLVAALEVGYQPERTAAQAAKTGQDKQPEIAKPAPILRERVVPKYEPPTRADTPADALAINLAESGRVSIERVAELLNVSNEEAIAQLQAGDDPLVFQDPETQRWETADVYLSGMVKRKLNAAKAAGVELNVKALEKVLPEPWTAENVAAQLGSTWVPPEIYAQFLEHLTGGRARVAFSALTNSFSVNVEGANSSVASQWGTDDVSAEHIVTRLLNSQAVVVRRTDADGKTYLDKEATSLAGLKAREVTSEFGDWIFKDGDRRSLLVELFNEQFNTRVQRQHNGQHLKLPGKVPDSIIKLRRHQMNAIWRGIYERFMLVDHAVGAGKTFTAIARAMERRRMGLSRKPMIVVPNHLVEQWQADIYRLYPGAKVLAAGKKDFEAKRRRRLFGKIATGDWDIVIVPHSSFFFIGISPETESRYLDQEMAQAQAAIEEAWEQAAEDGNDSGRRKPFGVKEAERLAEKIQARMDRLSAGSRDRLLTFEQLGVDDLTVDEAHEFKNLYYSSRLTGVRGMDDKTGSRKANDLYNKVRVLRENPNATVTFLTGTPISNSAVEMFTMLRYLAADALDEMGMTHFDAFRAQFVEATPAFEPTEAGRLKEVTRLGRTWSNMRALMDLYYSVTDAVSLEDIKQWYAEDNGGKPFPVPKVKGGKDRALVSIQPTVAQEAELQAAMEGFDGLEGIDDPYERNAERLRLMDRARKLSLDIRAVNPYSNSTEEGGKLSVVSQNIKRVYDQWSADRGTQLVFLDRSVPKARGDDKVLKEYDALVAKRDAALAAGDDEGFQDALEGLERYDVNEMTELRAAQNAGWNAYQQIKDNLVAMGIPANEIRFVQEANNDEQKAALFAAVNGGKVRVLIGSTPRMGAGTNVQERAVALHHVDVTWKPSDIEQREGRVIRQGNRLLEKYGPDFEVEIIAYATERTVDAKMWDLNATKLRTINGIRKYDGAFTMEFEDEEAVGMAEMAALASGNPLLLERVKLESEINNLELLERAHRRKMWTVEDQLDRARKAIENNPRMIDQAKERTALVRERLSAIGQRHEARTVTIEGKEYSTPADALRAAEEAIKFQQEGNDKGRYAVAIDGKRITTKDGVADTIGAVLGDMQPFEATIGGNRVFRRTEAARKITEALNAIQPNQDRPTEIGEAYGFTVTASVFSRAARGTTFKYAELALMQDGREIVSREVREIQAINDFVPANLRPTLDGIQEALDYFAGGNSERRFTDELERAKRDLPSLEARAKETFPKAQDLAAKRKRLTEVVGALSGGQAQQETPAAPAANEPAAAYTAEERGARARTSDEYTQDLFGYALSEAGAVPNQDRPQPAVARSIDVHAAGRVEGAKFAVEAGPRVVGELRTAFDRIDTAEQAAHTLAGLRKSPQERFQVLVLDAASRPISVLNLFAGATSQTGVYPEVVTKAVYETPGAARVWYAHNHPSQNPVASVADERLTKALSRAFGPGTGIDVAGHVIIAGATASELDGNGDTLRSHFKIPAGVRKHAIRITERRFARVGTLIPDEVIDSPEQARRLLPQITDGKPGVVLLNAQHAPVGFLPMAPAQMTTLRDGKGARLLFGAVARANASAAMLYFGPSTARKVALDAADNIHEALQEERDVRLLDVFIGDTSMGQAGESIGKNRDGVFASVPAKVDRDRVRTGINEKSLLRAMRLQFPHLSDTTRALLERGRAGKRGGVVLVQSADPIELAKVFASKTGRSADASVRKFSNAGRVNGFYDPKSGMTFLVGPNLNPVTATAVLLHEIMHGQQRQKIDQRALEMVRNRHSLKDEDLRAFLDRVMLRLIGAGEVGNAAEASAYIVEQAVIEGRSKGYALADGRFLSWVDSALGKSVGDFLRSFLGMIRSWMLRHGLGVQSMGVDDFVGYAMAGMDRASSGEVRGRATVAASESAAEAIMVDGVARPTGSSEDLRFSRASLRAMASKATAELNNTFTAPGKLSAWHKTIGTMYNLAERSPSFKPVFQAAQGFVDDVSHYAADAAEHAPRLLPRLDTWRDILKTPISAEDNKAVGMPIFEGTLSWRRDANGRPVRVDALVDAAVGMSVEEKVEELEARGEIDPGILRAWRALPAGQFAKMVDTRYDTAFLQPGIVWSDEELREMFKLDPKQIALYREFRASVDRSLDTMARAEMLRFAGEDVTHLRDAVMEAEDLRHAASILTMELDLQATAQPDRAEQITAVMHGIADRLSKVRKLQAEGYAPLSRFGKYTVDVVVDGNREYFGLFETAREANRMAERMRTEFGPGAVTQGTLSDEAYKLFAGITPESLELFGNMLGLDSTGDEAQDRAFQEYLRLTKTNRSALRRLIHRKGIAGFSEDVGRVLASFVYSNARQTASGLHLGDLSQAVNDIPKERGELKDVAVKLAEYIKNPQEEAQAIRGLLFAQYLGGSVASALVNMTQPAAVTFPWLSQHGGAKLAAAEIGKAAKQIATRGHRYESDLAAALKKAEEDGVVSPQEVHQLMAQARGSGSLKAGDGTRAGNVRAHASNAVTRLSAAWGKLFSAAEQLNRRITFIAAYRVAKQQRLANPEAFARRAVQDTQFVYSKASKMQWGRGAVGGTLMTFKTYSIAYLELMSRMWSQGAPGSPERVAGRKAVVLMLGMLLLMGGGGGLPFMEDAEDLIDGIAQIAGYNFSAKKARQQFLIDTFGSEAADFIERGASGLPGVPLDVSGRLGLGNLIPGTGIFLDRSNHTRDVLELLGPVGDFGNRIVSGTRRALSGNVGGALLEVSPVAVRNVAKGVDMAATGQYRDTRGYRVLETSDLEAALKAAGFQPAGVAKIQEANYLNQRAKDFYNLRAQTIRGHWAEGIYEKDPAKVQRAREMARFWNDRNPEQPMLIRMPDILRRVREMGKDKSQRIADTAPRAMRQQLRAELMQQ